MKGGMLWVCGVLRGELVKPGREDEELVEEVESLDIEAGREFEAD